jgi:GMP synthase-like glutamine amidotransferase
MIVYVDLEHNRLRDDPVAWEASLANRLKVKDRVEQLTGQSCSIVHYSQVSPACLRELNVRAVLVSGCATDFEHYTETDLTGLRDVYRAAAWPLLGFCGGCQLMAQTYGAEIGPLGPLTPGEPDPYRGAYVIGMKQERGFMPVRVRQHPLFAGLCPQPVFFQAHYWEVKSPPDDFCALGESDLCQVQAIAHKTKPLFGAQFHPELYDDAHPDGRKVLENFFRITGVSG